MDICQILLTTLLALLGFYIKNSYNAYVVKSRLALSLLTEIKLLMKQYRYYRSMSPPFKMIGEIDSQGNIEYKRGKMLLNESFLVIYDHNTDKLGMFSRDTIREVIVTYSMARGHIYSVNTWNNELSTKTERDRKEVRRYEKVLEVEFNQLEKQEKIVINHLQREIGESFKRYLYKNIKDFFSPKC